MLHRTSGFEAISLELGEGSSTAALDVPAFDGPSVSALLAICDPTGLDSQEREELLQLRVF